MQRLKNAWEQGAWDGEENFRNFGPSMANFAKPKPKEQMKYDLGSRDQRVINF